MVKVIESAEEFNALVSTPVLQLQLGGRRKGVNPFMGRVSLSRTLPFPTASARAPAPDTSCRARSGKHDRMHMTRQQWC